MKDVKGFCFQTDGLMDICDCRVAFATEKRQNTRDKSQERRDKGRRNLRQGTKDKRQEARDMRQGT